MNDHPSHRVKSLNALLKLAVLSGVHAAVQVHIRRGDDVNATDERGRTPLILATSRGHVETCRILLEAGADPLVVDVEGNSAVSLAKRADRNELVSLLYQYLLASYEGQTESTLTIGVTRPSVDGVTDDLGAVDLSLWEAEEDSLPPPADKECLALASALQRGISAHIPIDTDENWLDVDIDLPRIPHGRRRRKAMDEDGLDAVRRLFLVGLQRGCVSRVQIVEASLTRDGDPDFELEGQLILVLGDIGVVVDEADWHDDEPTRIDEEAEQLLDDALSFLSDLKSPESDPVHPYLNKDLGSASLLTREDEMELGQAMEQGLEAALSALSGSVSAIL